jgi:hypothetical protein
MPIVPDNDPNEAYEIGHMPAVPHGLPPDWWTVYCNGIPVYHFAPRYARKAEHYATDSAYRLSLMTAFIHERGSARP